MTSPFLGNGRRPHFFKMKDDLKNVVIGRRPQKMCEWKTTLKQLWSIKIAIFDCFDMEDGLSFWKNER